MKKNIVINGFGRIGRATFKILLEKKNVNIVAINDLTDIKTLAHLLQYDSVYGVYNRKVSHTKDSLVVDKKKYKIISTKNPLDLPWKKLKVDTVLECTGLFRTSETAGMHITAGAKRVIISAPAKSDDIKSIVLGVNKKDIKKSDKIISMASCTTNCLSPITDVINKKFGVKKAIMTTIHSYTSTQNLVDGPNSDLRRARTAGVNMIPTTTGAAIATTKILPELEGKFDGMSIRVPLPVVSICDVVFLLKKKTNSANVNKAFKKASKTAKLKEILQVTEEELVLSDFIGNPASAIVDLPLTKVVDGDLLKVIAWYDNEWGYSNRLADIISFI